MRNKVLIVFAAAAMAVMAGIVLLETLPHRNLRKPLAQGGTVLGPPQFSARILKITSPPDGALAKFVLTVNGTNVYGQNAILNFITNDTGLSGRDVVLLQTHTPGEPRHALFKSLVLLCDKAEAQLCFYYPQNKSLASTNITIVHWKTPFDTPREHRFTDYYVEGVFMGRGEIGLDAVMEQLKTVQPKTVALIRSRYTDAASYAPDEIPFRHREKELLDLLQRRSIELHEPNYYPFFPDLGKKR